MPVTPTYPGVYIEELPSGVRTITGVPTSVTAFLGRAVRGPVNEPVTINSFSDFERRFGGLHADYPMSYAVRDFYLNGGGRAVIVRLFKKPGGEEGIAGATVGNLKLEASNPGKWGNSLEATVDHDGITDDVAERYAPLTKNDLFNLTVEDASTGTIEKFPNLSVKDGPRRVDRVLLQSSSLVVVPLKNDGTPDLPGSRPGAGSDTAEDGKDSSALAAGDFKGKESEKTGLYALEKTDLFNLLCLPPDARDEDTPVDAYKEAMAYCVKRRAMLLVDPPLDWSDAEDLVSDPATKLGSLGLTGTGARNAAVYYPRVRQSDPEREGQIDTFVPCGIIAGVMARTDGDRGVWKAPAGLDASLSGIRGLEVNLTDDDNGLLNPVGINCLRTFPVFGSVVWGARTLRGADQLADEYKYIPVRRLALFLEESLYRGTQWVVFEPNDEPLWAQIRLNLGAFMHNLFRQGAFQGKTPAEAYFVKCDKETTTQNDINLGIVNILVGFAPLKPAEFVIIKIQQKAGQVAA